MIELPVLNRLVKLSPYNFAFVAVFQDENVHKLSLNVARQADVFMENRAFRGKTDF